MVFVRKELIIIILIYNKRKEFEFLGIKVKFFVKIVNNNKEDKLFRYIFFKK